MQGKRLKPEVQPEISEPSGRMSSLKYSLFKFCGWLVEKGGWRDYFGDFKNNNSNKNLSAQMIY